MTLEHGHARARERVRALEDEAIDFLGWYRRSRFDLMERFLEDLERPASARDVATLRRRFVHAVRHARRVLVARGLVTALLALGVVATLAATLAEAVWVPARVEAGVAATTTFLATAAAVTGSASVVLLVLRLAFDRYLELIETCATFLGMQIAASTAR